MLAKRDQAFPSLWRFDRMFEDLWSGFPFSNRTEGFAPNLDVFEDDDGLTIQAELPGLSQKDVNVEVDGSLLTLRGEKSHDEEKQDRQYHRIERRYGAFLRQVQLPSSADTDKISAIHRDGVLTIRVPKRPEARKKSVQIDVQ
jgi:HSP20 family protein